MFKFTTTRQPVLSRIVFVIECGDIGEKREKEISKRLAEVYDGVKVGTVFLHNSDQQKITINILTTEYH